MRLCSIVSRSLLFEFASLVYRCGVIVVMREAVRHDPCSIRFGLSAISA